MSRWPTPEPFSVGDATPGFAASTPSNPTFHFTSVAGRYVLLGFLPADPARRAAAFAAFQPHRGLFDDRQATAFLVATDAEARGAVQDSLPGQRWFFDPEGKLSRLYAARDAAGGEHPYWLLLDPSLRVLARAPLEAPEPLFALLRSLPPVDGPEAEAQTAPVLIVPRVFDADLCRQLIAYYDARGGALSGVMRDVGGRTVGVLDSTKSRRDVHVEEPEFKRDLIGRLEKALLPAVTRAFQFQASRLERYLVACYDASEGGYFRPHRDNETYGTAHRRFAVSINLNSEAFEGGDLRFPEFGPRTYRPPTGGAVVFCCGAMHEATPVTRGRRYAFLPFLYDEAGEAIRQKNIDLLDTTPAVAR